MTNIDEIRERWEKATPGGVADHQINTADARCEDFVRFGPGYRVFCAARDVEFFAHAHQDIRDLLGEVERLREDRERLDWFLAAMDYDATERTWSVERWWYGRPPAEYRNATRQEKIEAIDAARGKEAGRGE